MKRGRGRGGLLQKGTSPSPTSEFDEDFQDGFPNPYFLVMLDIPDSSEPKAQQQTRIAKNTSSPMINEEFCFNVRAFLF